MLSFSCELLSLGFSFLKKNCIRHVTPVHDLQVVMKYGDLVEYLAVADVFLDYILQNCSVSVVSCDFIVTDFKVDCKCWMHFVTGTVLQRWCFFVHILGRSICAGLLFEWRSWVIKGSKGTRVVIVVPEHGSPENVLLGVEFYDEQKGMQNACPWGWFC